jgi:hypothetical protein
MLEEARLESEAILKGAKEQAERRTRSLAAELAAADAELTARLAAEAERRITEEAAVLAAARARYERVGEGTIEAHARWVVDEVLRFAAGRSS